MGWSSWRDAKEVTVTIGRDLLYASMLGRVMASSEFSSIPLDILSRHAKAVLGRNFMYSREEGLIDIVPEGDFLDADGRLIFGDGTFADGLVRADAIRGCIRACEGTTAESLAEFVARACDGDACLGHVMGGGRWNHLLLHDLLCHAMGARELLVADIPSGRPLVLMDIDDCINVFPCDPRWHGHDPLPDGDAYPLDMEVRATFPKEAVGMSGPMGRRIPEGMPVRWSSELARDIRMLADETGATLAWLSSWMECSKAVEPLLWPDVDSPFAGYIGWHLRGMSDDGRHGKALRVSELLGSPRGRHEREEMPASDLGFDDDEPASLSIDVPCLVVIDDKGIAGAYGGYEGHDLFASAVGDAVDELTIAPDFRYGISRPQWKRIAEFVREHA